MHTVEYFSALNKIATFHSSTFRSNWNNFLFFFLYFCGKHTKSATEYAYLAERLAIACMKPLLYNKYQVLAPAKSSEYVNIHIHWKIRNLHLCAFYAINFIVMTTVVVLCSAKWWTKINFTVNVKCSHTHPMKCALQEQWKLRVEFDSVSTIIPRTHKYLNRVNKCNKIGG